jgi:hypothetical protein
MLTEQVALPWVGGVTTVTEAGDPLRDDQLRPTVSVRSCRTDAVVLIATGVVTGRTNNDMVAVFELASPSLTRHVNESGPR